MAEPAAPKSPPEEMAGREQPVGAPIHRSSSRPQLDLSGAAIHGSTEDRTPAILLPNQSDDISHVAIDIGGSLIKLVYFSRHSDNAKRATSTNKMHCLRQQRRDAMFPGARQNFPILGGRLHFVKFETSKINECIDFIQSKKLHFCDLFSHDPCKVEIGQGSYEGPTIKATGGGAFKYAELLKEKLGVTLDKEDEMDCLVAGANFLLRVRECS